MAQKKTPRKGLLDMLHEQHEAYVQAYNRLPIITLDLIGDGPGSRHVQLVSVGSDCLEVCYKGSTHRHLIDRKRISRAVLARPEDNF